MHDKQRAVCSIRGIPSVGSPELTLGTEIMASGDTGRVCQVSQNDTAKLSNAAMARLSINARESFVYSMLQTLLNQPIKIKQLNEITMGFTIPAFSIGVVLYICFHYLLGGLFN